jgi:Na+-transporting NADH:ubiquinone oxidoreductase subunit A
LITEGQEEDFQAGIDVLAKLTSGKIHLSVHKELGESNAYRNVKGVEKHTISGPHPSGNVGVQIHYIDPINKGEKVWFVAPQDLLIIGRLFRTGHYNPAITIALTGSEVKEPRYVRTTKGVCVAALLHNGLVQDNVRVISGNVFTGGKIPVDGYLRAYDQQITVIPEENEPEFFGWALPRMHKFSLSKAYFSWLTPNKEYRLTTSANGEKRAFVVTGEYEKVFPMDIYPAQLVKSVLMNDIEAMENLGIYEVSEEDFALAEFSCTSKMELQKIVREGMDMMITEMGV